MRCYQVTGLAMNASLDSSAITADELVGALDALGVHFLAGGAQTARALALSPAELLLGLARDSDARMRLAVIPLLLCHPEYAEYAPSVAAQLAGDAKLTFQCYYTAAYWLQRKYAKALAKLVGAVQPLLDLFSAALEAHSDETAPDRALALLSRRHQVLSGEPINWRGTYEHAAQCLLKQLTREKLWAT
jgi:hypothetical protein